MVMPILKTQLSFVLSITNATKLCGRPFYTPWVCFSATHMIHMIMRMSQCSSLMAGNATHSQLAARSADRVGGSTEVSELDLWTLSDIHRALPSTQQHRLNTDGLGLHGETAINLDPAHGTQCSRAHKRLCTSRAAAGRPQGRNTTSALASQHTTQSMLSGGSSMASGQFGGTRPAAKPLTAARHVLCTGQQDSAASPPRSAICVTMSAASDAPALVIAASTRCAAVWSGGALLVLVML